MAADRGGGCPAERGPRPEPGEEFEIVDRSQLPGPGHPQSVTRRRAAEGWSAPILTLARRATGNLSASFGSALRATEGLGGADGSDGTEGAARAGGSVGCAPLCPRAQVAAVGSGSRAGRALLIGAVKSQHIHASDLSCFLYTCARARMNTRAGAGRAVTPTCVPWTTTLFSLVYFRKMCMSELRLSV